MSNSRYWLLIVTLFYGLGVYSPATFSQLLINEVMTSNSSTLPDEDGDYPDWIELYNHSNQSIRLDSLRLSDKRSNPDKWQLPPSMLEPGEFLLVFASGKDRRQWIPYWETVADLGTVWAYHYHNESIPANWIQPAYNDAAWLRGPTGIGYGDGDDATTIPPTVSLYARFHFSIENIATVMAAVLHIDYDDGFVAYLNGHEIARANLGMEGVQPAYNATTDNWREAEMYQGGEPELYGWPGLEQLLLEGDNVLAVQVHNYSANSSDLSCIPFFTLGMAEQPDNPHGSSSFLHFPKSCLHTNFKLKSSGETLYLSGASGQIIDSVFTGALPTNYSLGRYPDGADNWYIFPTSTPGASNTSPGFEGVAPDPLFSLPGGRYSSSVELSITAKTTGMTVHYTTDGSDPDESSPEAPAVINIDTSTVIRARAFSPGYLPSRIITYTYFINESTTLPIVSLVTDPANLWDDTIGIYVLGNNYEPDLPYQGANFWQDWERPVHVEFFEPDGRPGFRTDAGVKIFGGWSRARPQKSVSIFFRGKYGMSELKYPLFPESPVNRFQAFNLRNSANDWDRTMFSDGMMQTLIDPLDIEYQKFRPSCYYSCGWHLSGRRLFGCMAC